MMVGAGSDMHAAVQDAGPSAVEADFLLRWWLSPGMSQKVGACANELSLVKGTETSRLCGFARDASHREV